MSDFDDDVIGAVEDLLAYAGKSLTYRNHITSEEATFTARKSTLPNFSVELGTGAIVEVRPVDFILAEADLPYGEPVRGQRIVDGTEVYEVWSLPNEKPFRTINGQTRIHTKRIQ